MKRKSLYILTIILFLIGLLYFLYDKFTEEYFSNIQCDRIFTKVDIDNNNLLKRNSYTFKRFTWENNSLLCGHIYLTKTQLVFINDTTMCEIFYGDIEPTYWTPLLYKLELIKYRHKYVEMFYIDGNRLFQYSGWKETQTRFAKINSEIMSDFQNERDRYNLIYSFIKVINEDSLIITESKFEPIDSIEYYRMKKIYP